MAGGEIFAKPGPVAWACFGIREAHHLKARRKRLGLDLVLYGRLVLCAQRSALGSSTMQCMMAGVFSSQYQLAQTR